MSKLLPGENLVLQDHPHWITVVKSAVVPVVLLVVVAVADFTILGPDYGFYTPNLRKVLSALVIAIALLWFIVVWIRWQSITYVLTDQRIKLESGVFGRQEKIIPIDRVQDCTTRQSLIGRILGYGRVEVDAAGAQGAEVLDHLPKPGEFQDQVFVQSEKRRCGGGPTAPSGRACNASTAGPAGLWSPPAPCRRSRRCLTGAARATSRPITTWTARARRAWLRTRCWRFGPPDPRLVDWGLSGPDRNQPAARAAQRCHAPRPDWRGDRHRRQCQAVRGEGGEGDQKGRPQDFHPRHPRERALQVHDPAAGRPVVSRPAPDRSRGLRDRRGRGHGRRPCRPGGRDLAAGRPAGRGADHAAGHGGLEHRWQDRRQRPALEKRDRRVLAAIGRDLRPLGDPDATRPELSGRLRRGCKVRRRHGQRTLRPAAAKWSPPGRARRRHARARGLPVRRRQGADRGQGRARPRTARDSQLRPYRGPRAGGGDRVPRHPRPRCRFRDAGRRAHRPGPGPVQQADRRFPG